MHARRICALVDTEHPSLPPSHPSPHPSSTAGSDAAERVRYVLDPKNQPAMAEIVRAARDFHRTRLLPMMLQERLRCIMLEDVRCDVTS